MSGIQQKDVKTGSNCVIDPGAELDNVVCGDGVIIGRGTRLRNVVIGSHTRIGRFVTLYSPDDTSPVRIGRHVLIQFGTFGEATGGQIVFGDYSVIAHQNTFLTSSGPGEQSPVLNELFPLTTGDVVIGSHCWSGAGCLYLPGSVLPEGLVIGAKSMVKAGEYIPWSVYAGTPAVWKKSMDREKITELMRKHQLPH